MRTEEPRAVRLKDYRAPDYKVSEIALDFVLDPDYVKKNPDKAQAYSGTPDWAAMSRMDFSCVGPLMNEAPVGRFTRFFFVGGNAPMKVLSGVFPEYPQQLRLFREVHLQQLIPVAPMC